MIKLYKHKSTITGLAPEAVLTAMSETERSLRTGSFQYTTDSQVGNDIAKEIAGWDAESKKLLLEKINVIAAGQKPNAVLVRKALPAFVDALTQRFIDQKAKGKIEFERRTTQAELALSLALGKAPKTTDDPSRVYCEGGKKIQVRPSAILGRLVVEKNRLPEADVFVYCLWLEATNKAWMVGWARREDLEKAPGGSRITNSEECPWRDFSHYIGYRDLRPMADLLAENKIQSLPDGLLFEKIPNEVDVCIPSKITMLDNLSQPDAGDDFFRCLGIDDPKTTPQPKPSSEVVF